MRQMTMTSDTLPETGTKESIRRFSCGRCRFEQALPPNGPPYHVREGSLACPRCGALFGVFVSPAPKSEAAVEVTP
jgi:ribosomal protein S27AE